VDLTALRSLERPRIGKSEIGAAWCRELWKGETSMKLRALFGWVLASSMAVASAGCSRNAIEAINLANEADKQKDVDVDGAISKYEQAAQLDPTNHRILYKLGMAYKKKEAWDKLSSTMARATSIAPKFANYQYLRGYALEEQAAKKTTSWEEAKDPFKKCIEADPNFADCYHELGYTNLWTDNEQEALINYTKAIEHKPDELRYYTRLADLYLSLGYTDQAAQSLKEALSFSGDKADSKFLLIYQTSLLSTWSIRSSGTSTILTRSFSSSTLFISTSRLA